MQKKYSAGLVSRRFWFSEFKLYVELRQNGYTDQEIKKKSDQDNIFLAVSTNRQKRTFQYIKRNVAVLQESGLALFSELDIDNQKLLNLITILMEDVLFNEFMFEVFGPKLKNGIKRLDQIDYRVFFTEKQRESDELKKLKEYTLKRLASAYRTHLVEAGLLIAQKDYDEITPKLLDRRIVQWLVEQNRKEIVLSLGGSL